MLVNPTPNIETLFKVEQPLTEIKDGFGFVGVVSYDAEKDLLQCHKCGVWVKHLPSYAWNKHGMKNKEYRMTYQLPLSYPLVNKEISAKIHKSSYENGTWQNFVKGKHRGKGGRAKDRAKYARTNASFHNKNNVCEAQIQKRYLLVADIVERDPSETDLRRYDSKLLWVIKNRFKTLNAYKRIFGFQEYKFTVATKAVGKICQDKESGALHIIKSLSKEEKDALIKQFGSFSRALAYIGKDFKKGE